MKVAQLLESRRRNWTELDHLCSHLESSVGGRMPPERLSRFATLYRAACADLALADGYQLPPDTVQYLHRLVGRSHNQFYRSRQFDWRGWGVILLYEVPQFIFRDRCVQAAFLLFWTTFIAAAVLAATPGLWPNFDRQLLGEEMIDTMERMYDAPIAGRDPQTNNRMVAFYIYHNTTIGLQCFAVGVLACLPGSLITLFNAATLGAVFGHMARPDVYAHQGKNFFHFVTAHGPFELTAIVLAAGAGMRLGLSWIMTGGLTREAALRKSCNDTMPVMGASMILFALAALVEGLISPSGLPYVIKAAVAVLSSGLLIFYFVVLGIPRGAWRAT